MMNAAKESASGAAPHPAPVRPDDATPGADRVVQDDGPSPFKKRRIEEEEAGAATTTTTAAKEEPAMTAAAAGDDATAALGAAGASAKPEEEGRGNEGGKAGASADCPAPPSSNGATAGGGVGSAAAAAAPAPPPAAEANGNKDDGDVATEASAAAAEARKTTAAEAAAPADDAATAAAGAAGENASLPPPAGKTAAAATTASAQPEQQQQQGEEPATTDAPLGAYLAREAHLAAAEARGDLSFEYVLNDGSGASSIWLAGLRCVYSKQLPNMPREYVARLVFDRRHASVAIVRRGSVSVLGGITYRRFPEQKLGEIAFCAVAASEQVRGFGTRLMNNAKALATSRDGLSYFLTYADNNAVGYFAKQGFTKKVTAPRSRWHGYVKDYDGGTLMECRLDPRAAAAYANLPQVLKEQRASVDAAVRGRSQSHVVWKGLERFSEENKTKKMGGVEEAAAGGGAPATVTTTASTSSSAASASDLFEFAPLADPASSIPGVAEAGWPAARAALAAASPPPSLLVGRTWRPASDPSALRAFAHSLLCELAAHEDAWPFLEPVDARDVPDYHQVVKDPMDFSTLKKRLAADNELAEAAEEERRKQQGALPSSPSSPPLPPLLRGRFYATLDIFVADARRIFSNARAYNAVDTIYYKLATRLEAELDAMFAARISWGVGGGGGGKGGGG